MHQYEIVLIIYFGKQLYVKEQILSELTEQVNQRGGDNRNRTDNPQLAKLVLYQLSYIPYLKFFYKAKTLIRRISVCYETFSLARDNP